MAEVTSDDVAEGQRSGNTPSIAVVTPLKRQLDHITALRRNLFASRKAKRIRLDDSLDALTALVFDTETTGLADFKSSPTHEKQPDLIQLGYVLVDMKTWRPIFSHPFVVQLRDGGKEIEAGAFQKHGISKKYCSKYGNNPDLVLSVFEEHCKMADVIVAHGIEFDLIVMKAAFHRRDHANGNMTVSNFSNLISGKRLVCTMKECTALCKLDSIVEGEYKWPSLSEAYSFATNGKELKGNIHDALDDAKACLEIFRFLVEKQHVAILPSPAAAASALEGASTHSTVCANPVVLNECNHGCTDAVVSTKNNYDGHDDDEDGDVVVPSIQIGSPSNLGSWHEEQKKAADTVLRKSGESHTIGGFVVRGDTFHHKETLRKFGGQWNQGFKRWDFFDDIYISEVQSYIALHASGKLHVTFVNGEQFPGQRRESGFSVSGKTFKHRSVLQNLGGRWDNKATEWVFSDDTHLSELKSSYTDLFLSRKIS